MGKTKKRIWIATAVLLAVVLVAGFAAGSYFYTLAIDPTSDKTVVLQAPHNVLGGSDEAARRRQQENEAWFAGVGYEDVWMQSGDGLSLHAYKIEQPGAERWAILAHGYNGTGRQMIRAAMQYTQWGYSVLLPDARGCGESEGDYIGMGWDERLDMVGWINAINEEHAPHTIVLHGVSMGGATVMMASGEDLPENVRAIVEDCGYTSAWDEFAYQLKGIFGLPAFPVMHFSAVVTRLRAGYWLHQASAVRQVAKSQVPILFIHGSEDTFVPTYMLYEVYEAASCEKELLVIEGAGHGAASTTDEGLYWGTVDAFLACHAA
ncbi:alpha/beta hydrolase [Ruminococcaceae bacterium OttesenSCG-928-O06]|nr:alpha/beta hydrolase [Ruminococcaceae bacterium OttesenSCG-928-O06]